MPILFSRLRTLLLLFSAIAGQWSGATPVLTQQPATVVVVESGHAASFTASAVAAGTIRWQWRHFGVPIDGATEATWTLANVTMADVGFYDVVVSDSDGSVTSPASRLWVRPSGGYPNTLRMDPTFAPLLEAPIVKTDKGIVAIPSGGFYVGGSFTTIAGQSRNGLARFRADGTLDPEFVPALARGFCVFRVFLQADGRPLVFGRMATIGTTYPGDIIRLNADGSIDRTYDSSEGQLIALQADGRLLAVTAFQGMDGKRRFRIIRLNSDGSKDPSFDTGEGFNLVPLCVQAMADGRILVGGGFSEFRGMPTARLLCLLPDGQLDQNFATGVGFSGEVHAVLRQADGRIVVGGRFSNYDGHSAPAIARLNADGSFDATFSSGGGFSGEVNALVAGAADRIVVGGFMSSYRGVACSRVARLNADGSRDASFSLPGTGLSGSVSQLALLEGGVILAAGNLSEFNRTPTSDLVALTASGELAFIPSAELLFCATATAVVPARDGKWLVGGTFTRVNGIARGRIARLNADGTLDPTFDPGTGFDDVVSALAVQGDGAVVVGGRFNTCNGEDRPRLVRLRPTGTIDGAFNTPRLANAVSSLALQADGRIVVGSYTSAGPQLPGLARLNSDGSLDSAFAAGASMKHPVEAVVVLQDGSIVAGGGFSEIGGVVRASLARVFASGTVDPALNSGGGFNSSVGALAEQANGGLLVGGVFRTFEGAPCPYLARFAPDCSADAAFNSAGASASPGAVRSLLAQVDGALVTAGNFSGLSRRKADGSVDTAFAAYDLPSMQSGQGQLLQVGDDGRLLVAGIAGVRDGFDQYGLVMLKPETVQAPAITAEPLTQTVAAGSAATFAVAAAGTDLTYQWLKDGVEIPGATSDRLTLTRVQPDDFGAYSVRVDGLAGSARSAAVVLGVSEVIGPRYRILDYFRPLVVGNEWVFTPSFTDPQPTHWRERIVSLDTSVTFYTGRENPVAHPTSAIELRGEDGYYAGGVFQVGDTSTTYLASDGVQCGLLGSRTANQFPSICDGPMLFPEALAIGESSAAARDFHQERTWGGTISYGIQFVGFETVATPAGTFADCLRVRIVSSKEGDEVREEWWARGVGPVRIRYSDPINPAVIYTLESYSVQQPVLPAITTEPVDLTGGMYQLAMLQVTAAGTNPLTYQWYRGESGDSSRPFFGGSRSAGVMVTPAAAGPYWVRVANRSGFVDSRTAAVRFVDDAVAFLDWIEQNGIPADQRDPLATPAGDGVPNLVKYAVGVPPMADAAAALPRGLLEPAATGGSAFVLSFNRNFHARNVRFALEVSVDLIAWNEVASELEVVGFSPRGTELVRLREKAPPAAIRRFARLKVEMVAP